MCANHYFEPTIGHIMPIFIQEESNVRSNFLPRTKPNLICIVASVVCSVVTVF